MKSLPITCCSQNSEAVDRDNLASLLFTDKEIVKEIYSSELFFIVQCGVTDKLGQHLFCNRKRRNVSHMM
jgi:hypothetical protein